LYEESESIDHDFDDENGGYFPLKKVH